MGSQLLERAAQIGALGMTVATPAAIAYEAGKALTSPVPSFQAPALPPAAPASKQP